MVWVDQSVPGCAWNEVSVDPVRNVVAVTTTDAPETTTTTTTTTTATTTTHGMRDTIADNFTLRSVATVHTTTQGYLPPGLQFPGH